jgi:hypothetical protein
MQMWLQVYSFEKRRGLTEGDEFVIETMYHTGVEAFGHQEVGGEQGPDLRTLEAVLRYVQEQFPNGWKVVDEKVVSAQ